MPSLVERRLAMLMPHEAEQFMDAHNDYCGQRPLRPGHVAFLARKMREGLFLTSELAYAKLPDGRSVIVDGQHTLHACVLSGVPFNASIYGYECKGEADLFSLYSETDQGMRRTRSDVVRAGRNIMPDAVRDIPAGLVSLFGAAILMAPKDGDRAVFQSRAISAQSRVFAVCARPEEACFLHGYQTTGVTNRIPVRMAMLATYRINPERARLFWDGVTDSDRLPVNDPRVHLHNRLLDRKSGVMSALAVRDMYMHCIAHWNAHVSGRAVQWMDATGPIPILVPGAPTPPQSKISNFPERALTPQTFTDNPQGLALPASDENIAASRPAARMTANT